MVSKNSTSGRSQSAILMIDDLVPQDHLVRKIDTVLNLEFIYPIVEATCSDLGRPGINPVVLIKLVFIQYLFGARSIRQTIKEVNTNVAYRWFLGCSFEEKTPRFSTFGKNYVRRFRETTVFEDIFAYILERAVRTGFVTEDNSYLNSIRIKTNANKHKFTKEMTRDKAEAYQDELEDEIDRQRIEAGKRPFTLDLEKEVKLRERKISEADPEGGCYVKGERKKQFAYFVCTSCDDNGLILSIIVIPKNIHGSQVTFQLVKQSKRLFPKINRAVVDAGYKTPKFVHFSTHLNLRPCLPYSRPKGEKGLLPKNEFLYDEYFDCYICPQDQMSTFSTVTREGYWKYKSNSKECVNCPLLNQCAKSKNRQWVITRHVWGDLMDEVEHPRLIDLNKSTYKKRKQMTGRIFMDIKEKYGMRRIRCRGLEKIATHTMLVFAAASLKKSAARLWRSKGPLFFYSKIRNEVDKKLFQARATSLEQLLSTV